MCVSLVSITLAPRTVALQNGINQCFVDYLIKMSLLPFGKAKGNRHSKFVLFFLHFTPHPPPPPLLCETLL